MAAKKKPAPKKAAKKPAKRKVAPKKAAKKPTKRKVAPKKKSAAKKPAKRKAAPKKARPVPVAGLEVVAAPVQAGDEAEAYREPERRREPRELGVRECPTKELSQYALRKDPCATPVETKRGNLSWQ